MLPDPCREVQHACSLTFHPPGHLPPFRVYNVNGHRHPMVHVLSDREVTDAPIHKYMLRVLMTAQSCVVAKSCRTSSVELINYCENL